MEVERKALDIKKDRDFEGKVPNQQAVLLYIIPITLGTKETSRATHDSYMALSHFPVNNISSYYYMAQVAWAYR